MSDSSLEWRPGSFTKNFSWGPISDGLVRLHECIRLGFSNKLEDVRRDEFHDRVRHYGGPELVSMNFFLFSRKTSDGDYIVVDELVFQAIQFEHSERFDKLALFAFNFSYAGTFSGATADQRRPALWANHYIKDHVAGKLNWNTSKVDANDIDRFLAGSVKYKAQVSRRKVATNLSYLYQSGKLSELSGKQVARWWVDSLFLALDRLTDDRRLTGLATPDDQLATLLSRQDFAALTGGSSLERDLATGHVIRLYIACGARQRLSPEYVLTLSKQSLADFVVPNDNEPQGAIHPTNARIIKSIPRLCAMLAKEAGFDILSFEELINFNLEEFVGRQTRNALEYLREQNIRPMMTAEELMKLTRAK